jgi:hypothetical protein
MKQQIVHRKNAEPRETVRAARADARNVLNRVA